jgi:drug/metabolite transporter (DMT)-like permease
MKRIPGSILRVDLIVIGVVLVWGMNFSIMKGLYAYFDPLAFTALRFSVAVATLSLVLKMRGLSLGVEKKRLAVCYRPGIPLKNPTWRGPMPFGTWGSRGRPYIPTSPP